MPERGPAAGTESGLSSTLKSAIQGIVIFLAAQFLIGQFFGQTSKNTSNVGTPAQQTSLTAFSERADATAIENYNPIPQAIAPIWPMNSSLDISIYVSASLVMPSLSAVSEGSKILDEKNFTIGDYKEKREIATVFEVPKEVQENGTLWAHFYVALAGHQLDPTATDYDVATANHFFRPLNQYLPKKKIKKTKMLLGTVNETEQQEAEETHSKIPLFSSYYHPNFTISVIPDSGVQNYPNLVPALRQSLQLESTGARDPSGQHGWYYPIFFVNTFWQLRSKMTELNTTVQTLPIQITLNNMANWKYSMIASIDDSMKQNQRQAAAGGPTPAGGDGTEFEMFKEILFDTNIYLLSTTFVVSILHTIFEMLAFKNDISHWRKKKDNVGTSLRAILGNVVMQLIIFLYLLDNSDGTSWMILMGQGFGIVVEAWKITKTVNVRLREPSPNSRLSFLPYHVVFEDKHKLTETEKKTDEYDAIAFKYLIWIAIPLLLIYAGYSLMYESHKSWYSFVIETLVGSVYAYGFLMMVPSLYINYRLKSVAHMPAKAMTYKFLNTFIDDLFAFTIKMPTLHRLATLRDDVIFFVYLYQKWAYKIDYNRVNEFGQGGEDEEEEDAKVEAKKEDKAGVVEAIKEGEKEEVKATARQAGTGTQKRK